MGQRIFGSRFLTFLTIFSYYSFEDFMICEVNDTGLYDFGWFLGEPGFSIIIIIIIIIIIMSLAPGTGAWPSWRTANQTLVIPFTLTLVCSFL